MPIKNPREDAYLLRLSPEERRSLNKVVAASGKSCADALRDLIQREAAAIREREKKK